MENNEERTWFEFMEEILGVLKIPEHVEITLWGLDEGI